MDYVDEIMIISESLIVKPFEKIDDGFRVTCEHPITNEGEMDKEYLVLKVRGEREMLDIWSFKGRILKGEYIRRANTLKMEQESLALQLSILKKLEND